MTESQAGECERVLVLKDPATGVKAIVAVHSTQLGPAHGGIRRWPYESLEAAMSDVVALARAMTHKCALAGIPAGGGKAVIVDQPGINREEAYRMVGRAVDQLGGTFFTGPDVNTTPGDLRWVAEQTPHVATDAEDGPGDLAAATAEGVLSAMLALAEHIGVEAAGMHVVVQGLGAVGMGCVARLAALGAQVSVFDIVPARIDQAVRDHGAVALAEDAVLRTRCDVFAPCALGGVLTEYSAQRLPARGVCGAANNVFGDDVASEILHQRDVPVVPDFLANSGALIQGALWNLKQERIAPDRLQSIGETTRAVLRRSRGEDRAPVAVALEMARERLET